MNKIGIVTYDGYTNYGNRLQNYAVQEIVRRYGYGVESIVAKHRGRLALVKSIAYAMVGKAEGRRYLKIRRFSKRIIPERRLIYRNFAIPKEKSSEYAYFITGSDQVWHPRSSKAERGYFFLKFAKKEQRVCISPSFGVETLPEELWEEYREGIEGFTELSCREKAGVDLIENLTGRKAEWIIDPTLALKRVDWECIMKKPRKMPKKYLLWAILGTAGNEAKEDVYRLAREQGLEVIEVFGNKIAMGPEQLLYWLAEASLVVTDSFHFTAFSINFNTPFLVLRRQGNRYEETMFSRLQSLLEMFHLEERVWKPNIQKEVLECDFTRANECLAIEREKFYEYINIVVPNEG